MKKSGGDLFVDTLINHGVTHVFGVPGAKIDKAFDVLEDRGPEVIVTRHEQNAALIAQGIGRITGKPGVVLVTSGPGVTNLATGLVTANSESDPVVAIGGNVKREDSLKRTHQSLDNAGLMSHVSKYSVEVQDANSISEAVTNAFRASVEGRKGAAFVSIPQDVISAENVEVDAIEVKEPPVLGPAPNFEIDTLAERIKQAKLPVFLLGMRASSEENTLAIRKFMANNAIPVVETFQGSGIISRELEEHFFGRIGLFRNQPGDELLKHADLVISVGYDPIEYDPVIWNKENEKTIIHIDEVQSDIDNHYAPVTELIGNTALTIQRLDEKLDPGDIQLDENAQKILLNVAQMIQKKYELPEDYMNAEKVNPKHIVKAVRELIDDETTVTVDVGSLYIYMARYFRSYAPRHLLFSNGMQTLGVALPWAIAASIVRPGKKIVSMAGDGGFLFSGQELETAVRLKAPIVQLIWNDGHYDMVKFQQVSKYGKGAAVDLGPVDYVKYAESMGAKGYKVNHSSELEDILKKAMAEEGPVIVDIPVDYSNNAKLMEDLLPDATN
ncbi:acetolactate synthase AlsS [Macrococcoides bohemicum]|uniref:Acetolactate synthase AlsS n=1 Tax=Macrococcoides bohemicum TaxID=1903056 RepID=A0AAE7QC15_9STAP|nr:MULTISPECIES: acetolactate synthase AlsS [Macrococcus]ATD31616.1 acetolactate synthase [Macrococcus sp. IME1552]MBC9873901.1 acetolactate synthase AlsS [Macrococcus bohemicus]QRN48591.1 acetolactate synthase AlsS [Macrococcus bohemicus]QYA42389.1 acetolactate synthase AlsS [Macrococcus bohemicus]